jgi:hypothetical protein
MKLAIINNSIAIIKNKERKMKKVSVATMIFVALFLSGCVPQPKVEVINDEFTNTQKVVLTDNYVGGGTLMPGKHGLYMDFTKQAGRVSNIITVVFYDSVAKDKTTVAIYNQRIGGLCTFRADETNIPVKITKGTSDYSVDIVGNSGNKQLSVEASVIGTGAISDDDLQKFINAKEPKIKCGEYSYQYNSGENNLYSNPQELNKNFIPLLKQFYEKVKGETK